MCHLILLLPFVSLPVFWLLPLPVAAPLYAVILVLSAIFYVVMIRLMRRPTATGIEGIVHASGIVEAVSGDMLSVRVDGEHWNARCPSEGLEPGDRVDVIGIDGLTLRVTRSGH